MAASRGHEEIVQLLVERGADIESKDWYGSRPISAAVSYDHYNIVNFLVEKGADVECEDSMQNYTANNGSMEWWPSCYKYIDHENLVRQRGEY